MYMINIDSNKEIKVDYQWSKAHTKGNILSHENGAVSIQAIHVQFHGDIVTPFKLIVLLKFRKENPSRRSMTLRSYHPFHF